MKKITGVKITEKPQIKLSEVLFSTGDMMRLERGKLSGKDVKKVVNRLAGVARYIAKNSDNNVLLPTDLESQISSQVKVLNDKGFMFRFYLRFGADVISEARLRELADPSCVYGSLWTPGTEKNSYTVKELNESNEGVSVMGAFKNADNTRYDPMLLLLDCPFDEEYSNGKITQLQASKEFLAETIDSIETSQTGPTDVYSMYIMDKISQIKSDRMVLSSGWMRVLLSLGRKVMGGGDSVIGVVCSGVGRLGLAWSYGNASGDSGVGFSAGLSD